MTLNVRCPHCLTSPEMVVAEPLRSGQIIICPTCEGHIKLDLARFKPCQKPVQPSRDALAQVAA